MKKWNDDKIIMDLTNIKNNIRHFPVVNEIINLGRADLMGAVQRNGGINKFRKLLGDKIIQVSKGYWNNKRIIRDIRKIKDKIGHFPTQRELIGIGRTDLVGAMRKCGGINKFRLLFGDKIPHVSPTFWTDETIIINLKSIISKICHFPTQTELINMDRCDLPNAIYKHGGFNKFRKLLGYELLKTPDKLFTDDIIITDLTNIKEDIGHFPTNIELIGLGRTKLSHIIVRHGGFVKFRKLLGDEILQAPNGYWTDEIIFQELSKIKINIGRFPTQNELVDMGCSDIVGAIFKHGGMNKFRELCGETPSLFQKYRSDSASYSNKRGKNTENIIKSILQDYCKLNGYPEPSYYKKLSKSHVLEFVCNTGKTIGIDVTNTRTKTVVFRKWTHKSYHKYLDELWVVVFSNVFTNQEFFKWNTESPENVRVMSIDTFLSELDYSLDERDRCKIDKLCKCNFHTKDELKEL